MIKMRLWYDNENLEENVMDRIGIRCSNYGKKTISSVKNTNNKYMVTKLVLNLVLHHVSLSCIVKTSQ